MKNNYDLLVIGAGSGGLVAAETAAKLGAKVALIEAAEKLGGECLHTGCVPSKALIHIARVAGASANSAKIGVVANPAINFKAVRTHIDKAIQTIELSHDNDEYYEQRGIDVIHGQAVFVSKSSVVVNGRELSAKRFIVATGSRPALPKIDGLSAGKYLTNESVFDLDALPASLIVIGGGPIGCELGQAFAMLGSKVTIIQSSSRLLPHDEPEAAAALLDSFKQLGMKVYFDRTIEKVSYSEDEVTVVLADGKAIVASQVLVATGRLANVPAGLDLAGVKTNKRGVIVNDALRSSNSRIFAVGDCNGGLQFTHAAAEQAAVAVQNALFRTRKNLNGQIVPWTTFTTPEVAHFGPLKSDLDDLKTNYSIVHLNYDEIDKAVSESETGYIELVVGLNNNVLAATVVGGPAAEVLARVIATPNIRQLSKSVQAYPTYAIGLRQMAVNYTFDKQLASPVGKLIKTVRRLLT